MKLFLTSNFKYLAEKFLPKLIDLSKKHNCLFVPYADEEDDFYCEKTTKMLESFNFKVIHLNEGYNFGDKIDVIYVKGGNTTKLIHLLRKFNQYDKVKELAEDGALYIGQSAGSVLAGSDTEWTLRSEPYEFNLKSEYGKDALKGFGFVNKMIFVHCSKYRFPFTDEIENAKRGDFKVKNTLFYGDYLKDRKLYNKNEYIVLKDNEAYYEDGEIKKILHFDWSKFPVLDEYRLW